VLVDEVEDAARVGMGELDAVPVAALPERALALFTCQPSLIVAPRVEQRPDRGRRDVRNARFLGELIDSADDRAPGEG
jgi:hypothetical protein